MSRTAHSTPNAPAPLPVFSQVIESNGFLFASGQIGSTSDGKLVPGSIGERTTQALKNLDAVFKSAGSSLAHAVKLTVFITDYSKFAEMNTAYLAMMPCPPPARSCIGVRALPFGTDVEIEAVAVVPSGRAAKL